MNILKGLLLFLAFAVVAWIFTLTGMADGVLQNVGGTTQQAGSTITGTVVTNGFTPNLIINGTLSATNIASTNSSGTWGTWNGAVFSGGISAGAARGILDGNQGMLALGQNASSAQWKLTASGSPGKITWARGDGGTAAAWSINSTGVSMGSNDVAATSSMDVYGAANIFGALTVTNSLLLPTNYISASFAPVAGYVKIASSNGVLYKITQTSTNLLNSTVP